MVDVTLAFAVLKNPPPLSAATVDTRLAVLTYPRVPRPCVVDVI